MSKLEGWKTVITAALALVAAILQLVGVAFSQDTQAGIATLIVSVLMIVLRVVTKTPVGGGA